MTVEFKNSVEIKGLDLGEWVDNSFKEGEAILNCKVVETAGCLAVIDSNEVLWFVSPNDAEVVPEYKLGDKYSMYFDYTGMLRAGVALNLNDSIEDIYALRDSMQDVNYSYEYGKLNAVIDAINLKRSNALELMTDFNIACAQALLS